MPTILKLKRIYLLGLIPISMLLIIIARSSSTFAEQVFSRRIYKLLSQILSTITGILPISLAEIIIILLPVALLILLIRFILKLYRNKEARRYNMIKGILNVFCVLSVMLFLFTILAGINYYRYPFTYYSKLEIMESSVDELFALTKSLAIQANELREKIPSQDEEGVFKLSMSIFELSHKADKAMEELSKEYSVLGGHYGSPKPIMLSALMSYTGITGIYMPFTMEANVNVHIEDYNIPVTMLHELSHLRGFMREDEANFIGYLAGMASDSIELQYSSTMFALETAGNALYRQDPLLYSEIRELYSEGIAKDLRADAAYWVKYEDTVVSTVSNKINDTYLKANNQTDGVKSYGRMLDLLLAKYRKETT